MGGRSISRTSTRSKEVSSDRGRRRVVCITPASGRCARSPARARITWAMAKAIADREASGRFLWRRTPEVHLGYLVEAEALEDVDEEPDLHPVPREEGEALEERPPPGVLPGEGLEHPRQLGEERVEQGAREKLRDPSPAGVGVDRALAEGTPVEPLDVADARRAEEGAHQPVDESGWTFLMSVSSHTMRSPPSTWR